MLLNQSPVVRLLLPFISGITVMILFPFPIIYAMSLLIVVFAMHLFFQSVHSLSSSFKWRWLMGLFISCMFFLSGCFITWLGTGTNNALHFGNINSKIYIARVEEPPVFKEKTIKLITSVHYAKEGTQLFKTKGKLLVYIPNTAALNFNYGDYFVFTAKPHKIEQPKNPEEFNYAEYLSFHNIYHQVFLKEGSFHKTGLNEANLFYAASYNLRDYLISILKTTIPDKNIYSVGSALLVGYDDDLERNLMNAYASSGVLHVLSVSGMHVAIIFKVLEWLLSFLLKIRRGKHCYFALIILVLWFYAFLTGLCPSVLRATMMISFIIVGKWSGRNTGIVNTLVVSCFFLVIYNPYLVVDAGFQLSFLAVLGIVLLHPLLFRHYQPRNKFLLAVWGVLSISICAQLITFPISLFYFHQFPNLFLFTNLLIIPATTAAIYGCIALVILFKVPILGAAIAKFCYACIWFSNLTVEFAGGLSFAVTNGISITAMEMVFIYIIIFTGIIYLIQKRWAHIAIFIVLLTSFLFLQSIENIYQSKQQSIAVYSIKGHTAIGFISGKNCYLMTDSALMQDDKALHFHLQQHWWKQGITKPILLNEEIDVDNLARKGNHVLFNRKKIMIMDSVYATRFAGKVEQPLLNVDYLVLTGNAPISLHKVRKFLNVQQIIIDGSNNYSKTKRWMSEARNLKIDCYSTKEKGALICNL